MPSDHWHWAFFPLPAGPSIIVITARHAHSGQSGFALDDLYIENCSVLGKSKEGGGAVYKGSNFDKIGWHNFRSTGLI